MTLLETLLNIYTQEPLNPSEKLKTIEEMRDELRKQEALLLDENPELWNPSYMRDFDHDMER